MRTILILQIAGLTVLLALTFTGDILHGIDSARIMAITSARTKAMETLVFRELLLANGSVYFPLSPAITPDPALLHREDRDITTPSGHSYTILTPKRLLSLVLKRSAEQPLSARSEIKTFQPVSSEETPDAWEAQALMQLQQGQDEVSEIVTRDGEVSLRYLYPLRATEECLKIRPGKGLSVGDIYGGLSITLPMRPFENVRRQHNIIALVLHGFLWFMGMGGIFLTFRMISQREKMTRAAKEELESVFDAIHEIITIQDRDMRILRVNKTTLDTFGAAPHELEGKYCYQVFRGADSPCPGCPELESIKNGTLHSAEICHTNLHKIFAVSVAPIRSENGEVTRVVHYAKDITVARKLEGQLRQAQKMEAIGTLAGGIAHDFNNIITAVLGYAELVKENLPTKSEAVADIDEVIRAGLRARDLVRQILTFSRQAEENIQPVKIQSITKEVLKLLRSTIPATIEFRQNIDLECESVLADPTQIHQVLMNLCTNAYHAMRDKGGILEVTLTRMQFAETDVWDKLDLKPGTYLRLAVSDTGVGMDEGVMERIFEPYFTTKKKGEGTGLGLSVVHGIVRNMGGHIKAYSEPGQGTTFHVYLPVQSQLTTQVSEQESPLPLPGGTERILLIDDEEAIVRAERIRLDCVRNEPQSEPFVGRARDRI